MIKLTKERKEKEFPHTQIIIVLAIVFAIIIPLGFRHDAGIIKEECDVVRNKYITDYKKMFITGIADIDILRKYHINEAKCYVRISELEDELMYAEERIQSDLLLINSVKKENEK